jgi:hypothetical protein
MACAAVLGQQRIPAWIRRHLSGVGSIFRVDKTQIDHPIHPYVIIASSAPGSERSDYKGTIRHAVEVRILKIRERTKLILKDYKDWRTVRSKAANRQKAEEE